MERLLPALEGLPPAYLVGGGVRDLLRGEQGVDLDLAMEGDARATARELAGRLGGHAREHERFGTATVRSGDLAFDLAATRRETYEHPGALPRVEPAALAEDLGRRDFTVNSMAIGLTGEDLGHLYDPHGGLDDLGAGVVRVLHPASFVDDPTRLLRALRYEARLGFAMDADTERLAKEAAGKGALGTVSGPRVRDELMDLLSELEAPSAVRGCTSWALTGRSTPRCGRTTSSWPPPPWEPPPWAPTARCPPLPRSSLRSPPRSVRGCPSWGSGAGIATPWPGRLGRPRCWPGSSAGSFGPPRCTPCWRRSPSRPSPWPSP
jgi:Poly A polymerase head domain